MINALDYLKDKGKIKSGDKIGHVYFEGEYGENGLAGHEVLGVQERHRRSSSRRSSRPTRT